LLQLLQLTFGTSLGRFLLAHQLLNPAEFFWWGRGRWRRRRIHMVPALPVVIASGTFLVRVRSFSVSGTHITTFCVATRWHC